MKEQYERFCEALRARDAYSTNCDLCPIQTECEAFSATLSPLSEYCEEYSCEAILFRYVMHGETPKIKEV